jgi:hypothetical protein
MKRREFVSRVVAVLLFAFPMSLYIHYDFDRWNRLGREAFLAYESHRFDQSMAFPRSLGFTMTGTLIIVVGFFGVYELVVSAISAVARLLTREDGKS